jgi:hypothetical protein
MSGTDVVYNMADENFFADSESVFSGIYSINHKKKNHKAEIFLSMYNEKEESGFVLREMKPVKVKLN